MLAADGGRSGRGPALGSATAALVVEIVSPGDESWAKFGFYAAHGVDEVVIVDPEPRTVTWFARRDDRYEEVVHSAVLDVDVREVVAAITWPPSETA